MDLAAQPAMKEKDPNSRQSGALAAAHVRSGTSIPTPTCKSHASPPVSQGHPSTTEKVITSQLKLKGREGIDFGAVGILCLREMRGTGQPRNQNGSLPFYLNIFFPMCVNEEMHFAWWLFPVTGVLLCGEHSTVLP